MLCYTKQTARNLYRSIQSVIMYHVFTDSLIWSFCVCVCVCTRCVLMTLTLPRPFRRKRVSSRLAQLAMMLVPMWVQRAVSLNCIIDVCRVLQCCCFRYLLYTPAQFAMHSFVCRANHGLVLCTVRCQRTLCQPALLESLLQECLLAVSYRPHTSLFPVELHRICGN